MPEPRLDTTELVETAKLWTSDSVVLDTLGALAERISALELERDETKEWAHRQADLATEACEAADAAEAKLAEVEAALERITNQAERSIEPENHVAASWVAAHARAALRSLRGKT